MLDIEVPIDDPQAPASDAWQQELRKALAWYESPDDDDWNHIVDMIHSDVRRVCEKAVEVAYAAGAADAP